MVLEKGLGTSIYNIQYNYNMLDYDSDDDTTW